jgi:Succinylglutamate desuccinylase / Aspartoacylase family
VSKWRVLFEEYAARWRDSLAGVADAPDYGTVVEGGRSYPLLSASVPGERLVVVTSGFHGDEKAGPLTLLESAAEVLEHARASGVGLRLYPCVNPSGFEAHTRYNTSGEHPNNDFLRYEVAPGVWRDELRTDERFLRYTSAQGTPKETAALAAELAMQAAPVAALDLHQDNFIHGSLFYAYIFGNPAAYRPLLARSGALVPVLRSSIVDSGHEPGSDVRSDHEGFIVCHDGSITDHFHRAGVPYTAAIETTTETPRELAHEINLIWIRGFIDLAASVGTPG